MPLGKGLKTKINANIGTSKDRVDLDLELEKVKISVAAGADTIMDLSTGGDIRRIRQAIIKASTAPRWDSPYLPGCRRYGGGEKSHHGNDR